MAISGTPVQMMKYLKEKSAVRDFQNVWRALREVSRKNGLEELWSGPEKQLRDLLVRWGDEVIPRDKTYVSHATECQFRDSPFPFAGS